MNEIDEQQVRRIRQTWIKAVIGSDSINAAAVKAGINQPTLSRHVSDRTPTVETILALARAYRRSPAMALVDTKFLTKDELRSYGSEAVLADATDDALVEEVARRIARTQGENTIYDEPITPPNTGNVTNLSDRRVDFTHLAAADHGYNPSDEAEASQEMP